MSAAANTETNAHESLREYLRWTTEFRRDNPSCAPPADWKHLCMEDLVLAEGRDYTPAPLPDGIPLGTIKECFTNATELANTHPDLTYVEGYATSAVVGIAVHHAWCATPEGVVVDNTWRDYETGVPKVGVAYVGIPVSAADHLASMVAYKCWGVLDIWEHDYPAVRLGWDGFLAELRGEGE